MSHCHCDVFSVLLWAIHNMSHCHCDVLSVLLWAIHNMSHCHCDVLSVLFGLFITCHIAIVMF